MMGVHGVSATVIRMFATTEPRDEPETVSIVPPSVGDEDRGATEDIVGGVYENTAFTFLALIWLATVTEISFDAPSPLGVVHTIMV